MKQERTAAKVTKMQQDVCTIGVLAGTPIDTQFGQDFLHKMGCKSLGLSVSETPQQQTQLQALDQQKLTEIVLSLIDKLVRSDAQGVMIYCNSLSGAIDLEKVKAESPIPVITPLDVYQELTFKYRNFGLFAANCQSCANIERTILNSNPTAKVIGIGNLQLVEDIEHKLSPEQLISLHALPEMADALMKSGVQVLILGCTHFDYFYDELRARLSGVELFLPSKRMLEILRKSISQSGESSEQQKAG